jgi:type II secretory ATPase GspE/PulE/Tfp pilus assembly ATPase PilB-like protein
MAQRLVRKLCAACKQERALSPQEQAVINVHLATIVDRSLVPENTTRVWDASEHGCEQCGGRGYKGRIAVFEAVFMDSIIEQIMREKPSEREIAAAARPQGIPTMQEDGVIKILRGTTSLSEVSRVVDLERH